MSPTLKMILRRLGLGLATLFVVSILIFISVELLPGDAATALLGQSATEENLAALRRNLGLDQPLHVRYLDWLGGIVQGDLGNSVLSGKPIVELIGGKLGNTFFLAGLTALIAVPISLALGLMAALWRNSIFDRVANAATLTSISFPEFFVAYILGAWLATSAGVLPWVSKSMPVDPSLGERLYYTLLPALTMTLVVVAHMMRLTRAAIINLMALPYIEMARLKGASQTRIIVRHALPNALAPIVNVIALNLAYLITGVVLVEVVFSYPGLGQFLVDNVTKRDVTVVQAICLIFAATYILLNLVADVLSIVSNPRLLHPK